MSARGTRLMCWACRYSRTQTREVHVAHEWLNHHVVRLALRNRHWF